MTWNLKKLNFFFVSLFDDRAKTKIDLKIFIRYKTCWRYCRMLSLCDRYWVIFMKSINARMKFKPCDHLFINKNVMTSMICRNTIFCSIFVHCLTSKKRIKILKFVNDEIFLNRAFKRFNFDKFCVVTRTSFHFLEIDIFVFRMILTYVMTCIIMLFNNWWRISIIMISLIVESSFGQKFKSDPRVDVLSRWTYQRFQFDSRIDVRRILSSLFDANRMR